jgi:hypothetical protein
MTEREWLTLRQAASLSGYSKKALLALVERGHLPAARTDGKWLIAAADLVRLPRPAPATARQKAPAHDPLLVPPEIPTAPASSLGPPRAELALLLDALRERDEQIARLQEERARLAGQVGFLQGLLIEREARQRVLDAVPAARPESPVTAAPVEGESTQATASVIGHDGAIVDGDGALPGATGVVPPDTQVVGPPVPAPSADEPERKPMAPVVGAVVAAPVAMVADPARRPSRVLVVLRFFGLRS